jgi:hypothetical protein
MPVTSRNDRYDTDPRELRLIRIGHFLWRLFEKNSQDPGIDEALADVWDRKRQLRLELEVERTKKREATRQYFEGRKPRLPALIKIAGRTRY